MIKKMRDKGLKQVDQVLSPLTFSLDVPLFIAVDRIVEVTEPTVDVIQSTDNSQPQIVTKRERFVKWRNSVVKRLQDRWSNTKAKGRNIKCFNFRKNKKKDNKLTKINRQEQQQPQQQRATGATKKPSAWSRLKPACCRFFTLLLLINCIPG